MRFLVLRLFLWSSPPSWSGGGTCMDGWLNVGSTHAFFRCCHPQCYILIVFFAHSLHAGSSDFWVHSQDPEQYSPANSSTAKLVGGPGYHLNYGDLSYIEVYFTTLPFYFSPQIRSLILSL